MKKGLLFALCAVLAIACLSGCVSVIPVFVGGVVGKGDAETFTFNVGEITEIRVALFCDIRYYAAPSDTVTLTVQPNLKDHIIVEEKNGVLTVRSARNIAYGSNTWSNGNIPVLTVSAPALNRLDFTGAGTFTTYEPITADTFILNMTGAGQCVADLDVNRLTVRLSGAGDMELSGKADYAELNMSGAGRLGALALQTREASVNLSGVGLVTIYCTDNLSISAGGLGSVEYKGSANVDISRGGLVSVRRVD
jgi:hypothetical protein